MPSGSLRSGQFFLSAAPSLEQKKTPATLANVLEISDTKFNYI